MTDVWTNLAVFAAVYIPTVALIWAVMRKRARERCDHCGAKWEPTGRGASYHICEPRQSLRIRREN